MIEQLIINRVYGRNRVIGCIHNTSNDEYVIKYKCMKCGKYYMTRLGLSRAGKFRCDTCNNREYILPVLNSNRKKIVGYRVMDRAQYTRFKLSYEGETVRGFIRYVNDCFS